MKKNKSKKLVVILGATATGKTKLAVKLANKYNGEIVSADSRQVYSGMDIGTGKDLNEYQIKSQVSSSKSQGNKKIKYHLIDVISPNTEFNVAKFQKLAYQAIDDILDRGKLPLLVGGTGLYIDAVIKGYKFSPPAKKNPTLPAGRQVPNSQLPNIRKELNTWSNEKILAKLKLVDPKTYNVIDMKNRRRVQRALEIYYQSGLPKSRQEMVAPDYDILVLGVRFPLEKIYKKIDKRLKERLEQGMIEEIRKLHAQGVSWKRLESFGLEYRHVALYLQGKLSYEQMFEQLKNAIHHFSKRQLTWFKRNPDIVWVSNFQQVDKNVKEFIKNF